MSSVGLYARLAVAGLVRSPRQTALRVSVVGASVALLAGMVLFISDSLRTASATAVRSVPLDWQGPVPSYSKDVSVARRVGEQNGIGAALPTATAPFAGATHNGMAGHTATGSGSLFAVPPGYSLPTFRMLQGRVRPGQIVLDQQMAATLQARIGDTVRLAPAKGGRPQAFTVSGVALITAPDQVFQPLNPQLGPAPAQPPSNAAILPLRTFARSYAPHLGALTTASPLSNSQPGAQTGVQWEVQAQLDAAPLTTGSASAALKLADQTRNRVERSLPGQVHFVDNLSDSLNTAAGDALYGQALYIMLAVPGALIALGVAYLAALGTSDRDRRDMGLLRARGATRRDLLMLAAVESGLVGIAAGVLAAAVGTATVGLAVAPDAPLTATRVIATTAVSVMLAIAGFAIARVAAVESVLRAEVAASGRAAGPRGTPAWRRYYLDVVALAGSGLIYWLTSRTGFSAVVNPDSNPTLSLAVYMFFGPALLWLGSVLLLVRLRGRALAWLALRASRSDPGSPRSLLLASAGRRGAAINRGLVVVGLLLAFGTSLAIFSTTYDQQARVDAELTLGADVAVSAPPGTNGRAIAKRVAAVNGVSATTALDHTYAYVGPDLQDTYGIDPAGFTKATTLRDSYFLGGTASEMMSRLQQRRDGILVSLETITDYSLRQGDLLKLRVLDQRSGRFRVARFHVVGTVQEFPSAPRDSFMVGNASYLESLTHSGGPNVIFAKTGGSPTDVAAAVARATRAHGTVVKNIDRQAAQTVTSLTTVDLAGISQLEEAFTLVLVAAAMVLFVATAVAERRHELATMASIGASVRRAGAFGWSEAGLVLGASLILAAGLGWLVASMLVAMLTHVFDPPPAGLAIPWPYLATIASVAILATLIACFAAARTLARMPLGSILREP